MLVARRVVQNSFGEQVELAKRYKIKFKHPGFKQDFNMYRVWVSLHIHMSTIMNYSSCFFFFIIHLLSISLGKKNCNKQVWNVIITKKQCFHFPQKRVFFPKPYSKPPLLRVKARMSTEKHQQKLFFQQFSALGLIFKILLSQQFVTNFVSYPERMGELAILSLSNESSISKSQLLIPFTKDILPHPISFWKGEKQ